MSRKKHKKSQERRSAETALRDWQRERLECDRELPLPAPGPSEVTVLAYFVKSAADAAAAFPYLECAIRETWRRCGFLRTVIVADRPVPEAQAFLEPLGPWGELQVERSLDPARPQTIDADMNARLATRFRTPHVLVVRDDAFPLRPGLGSFLDDWDFIGAPLAGGGWWAAFVRSLFNMHVMDGGFSLRSRKLCEAASAEWNGRHAAKPWRGDWAENLFRTKYLPRVSMSYRSAMRLPVPRQAERFSVSSSSARHLGVPPFGFSGARTFQWLLESGKVS